VKTKCPTKIVGSLSLTSTSWSSWCTTHGQVKCLSKSDVASISEWSDDKSTAVSDILVVILGSPVTNLGSANTLLFVSYLDLILKIELELTLPLEVTLICNLLFDEHLDHISLVYINGNDSDDLDTKIFGQWMSDSLN
jgi:hypothetical protein